VCAKYLNPPGQPSPVGQYSNVAVVPRDAELVHVAGQLPVDDSGAVLHPGDFDRQADLIFSRLSEVLSGAGSSLSDVVFLRAFMVRDDDFPRFRDARAGAYSSFGVDEPPPATTIVVRGLYGGALVELDAVAVRSG